MTHQHTPTPWSVRDSDGPFPVLVDGNGGAVYPHDGEALTLIVRAVNAYEADQETIRRLREAAEAAEDYLCCAGWAPEEDNHPNHQESAGVGVVKILRAALAHADAKTQEGGQT